MKIKRIKKSFNEFKSAFSRVFAPALNTFFDLLLPPGKEAAKLLKLSRAELLELTDVAEETELPDSEAVLDYREDLARALVWQIKYKGNRKLAELAGELLYEQIIGRIGEDNLLEGGKILLMPIPLDKQKRKKKSFNQTELIARAIVNLDRGENLKYSPTVLEKIKLTKRQTEIKRRKERLKNLKGAFGVRDPEAVKGRNIILIDDVITTGATVKEARRALKSAGAEKVWAFALAH